MGYCSNFKLSTLEKTKINLASFLNEIKNSNFYDIFAEEVDDELSYLCSEDVTDSISLVSSDMCKWYESFDDLKEFSKKFPDNVFQLDIEGEDGEKCRAYFKNGKCQEAPAIITYDEFDETKLK